MLPEHNIQERSGLVGSGENESNLGPGIRFWGAIRTPLMLPVLSNAGAGFSAW
jgi:hypothetical protein